MSGLFQATIMNPAQPQGRPEEASLKSHHLKGGKGFCNPWASFKDEDFTFFLRHIFWRRMTGEGSLPDTSVSALQSRKPTFRSTRTSPAHTTVRATWLGHACYYVEFPSGLRVLFDPVFEQCCTPDFPPFPFLFKGKDYQRFTQPPCEIEDLPFVDLVCISHNHYDHLSYPTTGRIKVRFPDARWCVPLGVRDWFVSSGIERGKVVELDWWDDRDIVLSEKGVEIKDNEQGQLSPGLKSQAGDSRKAGDIKATISALPCQHSSARGPFDRCKTLWCSWSVESGGAKVYFAGDTGYRAVPHLPPDVDDYGPEFKDLPVCPAFKQIGEHRGPFDLGLIPVGAYEPRFVMSSMHANPRDAVRIFKDTGCKRALGMHWGTWTLTEEDVNEPPVKLREACREVGIPEHGVFDVVELGESKEFEPGEAEPSAVK